MIIRETPDDILIKEAEILYDEVYIKRTEDVLKMGRLDDIYKTLKGRGYEFSASNVLDIEKAF